MNELETYICQIQIPSSALSRLTDLKLSCIFTGWCPGIWAQYLQNWAHNPSFPNLFSSCVSFLVKNTTLHLFTHSWNLAVTELFFFFFPQARFRTQWKIYQCRSLAFWSLMLYLLVLFFLEHLYASYVGDLTLIEGVE